MSLNTIVEEGHHGCSENSSPVRASAAFWGSPEDAWEDITDFFVEATTELDYGQLIHVDDFNLWDAMSCIEMMDPKMDAGMDIPPEERGDKIPVSGIKDQTFSAADIIGIIDQLCALEATWISGYLLSQTLFTCVYLHQPYHVRNSLLQAYIFVTLKTADLVHKEIMKGRVADEEDFISDNMRYSLAEEMTEHEALASMLQAENTLAADLRRLKGKGMHARELPEIEMSYPEGREQVYIEALLARLRFRRAFYTTIASISRHNLPHARKSLAHASTQIALVKNSLDLSVDVSSSFDVHLTRKHQAPPKPIASMTRVQAVSFFEETLKHIQQICTTSAIEKADTLLKFLAMFAEDSPNVLSRSLMYTTILRDGRVGGRIPLREYVRDSIVDFTATDVFDSTDTHTTQLCTTFLHTATDSITSLLTLFAYNRPRQHRRAAKLVYEFESLQQQAEAIDLELQAQLEPSDEYNSDEPPNPLDAPFPFSSWVYHHKLRLLTHYLLLGYELDLYSPHEHLQVIYHLEYLFEIQTQHLQRTRDARRKFGSPRKNIQHSDNSLEEWLQTTQAHQLLFRGLFYMAKVARRNGLVPLPTSKEQDGVFNEESQYKHRFRLFGSLASPEILTYQGFLEMLEFDAEDEVDVNLHLAEEDFTGARDIVERLLHDAKEAARPETDTPLGHALNAHHQKELQDLIRVCISNSLAVQTLAGKTKTFKKPPSSLHPALTFTCKYHKRIPTASSTL
ncbi:Mak10 subunit, NatC N-terminal acetyltransferase-domain-containing protein [Gaertneriomyces semiglobifer]|nr:Mak10 subunit, NatC N-terminal acetyltransferase-domain-containing protein [Gaertneriomyces semiglobifer]